MRGYHFQSMYSNTEPIGDVLDSRPKQNTGLEVVHVSPILLAMHEQQERRRMLFQRHIISRTVPDAEHSLPRISFLERQQGE